MTVGLIAALTVSVLLAAALFRLAVKVFGKYGEALAELKVVRARLEAEESGTAPLRLQTPAPDFRLQDLDGNERTLKDFVGQPLMTVFFNSECRFCQMMAADVGGLAEGAPRLLLIAAGDAEKLRGLAERYDWHCDVLLDPDFEVGKQYRAMGTPMGYLVDEEGRIASDLKAGTLTIARLEKAASAPAEQYGSEGAAPLERQGMSVRDVSLSNVKRDGLAAGAPAPDFALPDLSGAERSLNEFLGKRVLLVFSDTDCGPCQTLAPQLVGVLERDRENNLEVVMVSRGGAEANQAKASEHGLTFPVLLQRSWEVSKQYGMFATPIAYLIDEGGMVANDVAVGSEAILQLVTPGESL